MGRSTQKLGGVQTMLESKIQRSATGSHVEHGTTDVKLAGTIGTILHHYYGGHFWAVEVDSHQGIYTITIPVLLGNWKHMEHLTALTHDRVRDAGGEILERFKIPRSGLNFGLAQFVEARNKHRVQGATHRPPS